MLIDLTRHKETRTPDDTLKGECSPGNRNQGTCNGLEGIARER
jgi:hypothetical protein